MRNYQTQGFIIKRRNIGEADRILTVFTKHTGKIQIKAIGVRRISSRRASHIELLNLSQLHLYKANRLPILTEAQTIQDFSFIKENLLKVGFAYHICELIDGLCPENQENKLVFSLLHDTLEKLSQGKDIVSVIHAFEINLLTHLGFYRPQQNVYFNTSNFIENILERKLKTRYLLQRFY